jgi:alkylhydroperoxidase family enzyme
LTAAGALAQSAVATSRIAGATFCANSHSRRRKRYDPATPASDHISMSSGFAARIVKCRAVSAP